MEKPFLQRLKNYFHNLDTIDIIILIPLIFGAYLGFKKGFIMTIFKLLAVIIGLVLGFKLVYVGAQFLAPHIGDANGFLPIISFILILICVIVLVNFIGKIIQTTLKAILLGGIDKVAGAALNFIRWAFLLGTIFWLMERGGINLISSHTENSLIYHVLIKTAPAIIDFFSQLLPFASSATDYIKELNITV